jgi:hypothetical protein
MNTEKPHIYTRWIGKAQFNISKTEFQQNETKVFDTHLEHKRICNSLTVLCGLLLCAHFIGTPVPVI